MRTIPSLGLARVTDIGAASDCVVLTCKKKKKKRKEMTLRKVNLLRSACTLMLGLCHRRIRGEHDTLPGKDSFNYTKPLAIGCGSPTLGAHWSTLPHGV